MIRILGLVLCAVIATTRLADAAERGVFSPDSFWYQPIPKDAPLHANSAGFVQDFLRQKSTYFGTVGINTTKYASPVYVVGLEQPVQQVHVWDCQNKGYIHAGLSKQWEAVPLPSRVQAADGTDAELTVYQPSTDTLWEFWQFRRSGSDWQACWGGRMGNVSKNMGIWFHPFGVTAVGLPFIGGQLGVDELRRGTIDHVIGISLVETESAEVFSWPATRSDGLNPTNAPNRIPQGLRFRLDPAVDVERLPMHPLGKMIARAAQTYGFVVWDKAGAITLRGENPFPYMKNGEPNPYNRLFAGTPQHQILDGFPWEKVQFLPMNYGRP